MVRASPQVNAVMKSTVLDVSWNLHMRTVLDLPWDLYMQTGSLLCISHVND